MRRIAKCSRCLELYRAPSDGSDNGVCALCHESDRLEHEAQLAADLRRRERITWAAVVLLFAGGVALLLFNNTPGASRADAADFRFWVQTDPPGVDVMLDERRIGTTGPGGRLAVRLPIDDIAVHQLAFNLEGYSPQRRAVSALDVGDTLNIVLVRTPVQTEIHSDPPGATVWIDGNPVGTTPFTGQIPAEQLVSMPIRLVKEGYEPIEITAALPPPRQPWSWRGALNLAPVEISVETDPPGASLLVDGRPVGTSPLSVRLPADVRGRTVVVQGELPGFAAVKREMSIPSEPGPRLRTALHFAAIAPRLHIDTEPSGATVRVKGRDIGTAPCTFEVAESDRGGPIEIEARIGRTHYGRTSVDPPPPDQEAQVRLPVALAARRVVLAVAADASEPSELWHLRERVKDEIAALSLEQEFLLLTDDGITVRPHTPDFVRASAEQKVRAYDTADQFRIAGGARPSGHLLAEAAARRPEAVILFAGGAPGPVERWQSPGGDAPILHVIGPSRRLSGTWLVRIAARSPGSIEFTDEAPMLGRVHDEEQD